MQFSSGSYKVSKLASIPSGESMDDGPMVKIRNRTENIFIPAVTADLTPRTSSSAGATSTSNSCLNLISPEKPKSRRGKKKKNVLSAYKSPVRLLTGKDVLAVEVQEHKKPIPVTKLQVLENYLPRELRANFLKHSKSHSDRLTQRGALYPGKSPVDTYGAVALLSTSTGGNQQDGSFAMMRSQSLDMPRFVSGAAGSLPKNVHLENLRLLENYHPKHNSSGALSYMTMSDDIGDESLDSDRLTDDFDFNSQSNEEEMHTMEVPPVEARAQSRNEHTLENQYPYQRRPISSRSRTKGVLWGTDSMEGGTIFLREEKAVETAAAARADKLRADHERHKQLEEAKHKLERDQVLQLKTLNTLFNTKLTLADLPSLPPLGSISANASVAGIEDSSDSTGKILAGQIDLNLNAADRQLLQQAEELDNALALEMDERQHAVRRLQDEYRKEKKEILTFKDQHGVGERERHGEQGIDDEEEERIRQIVESSARNQDDASVAKSSGDESQKGQAEEIEKPVVFEIDVRSEVRGKLRDLAKYVNSHSTRKITASWNFIEGKFKSSTLRKTVMHTNEVGLSYPVKAPALTLSTLAGMLCSPKIKIGWRELQTLYSFLDVTIPETFRARKIAAISLMLGLNTNSKSKISHMLHEQLAALHNKEEEKLITLDQLLEISFPSNPEEREEEFANIRDRKHAEVQELIEEKKRKDKLKEKTETRRRRLMKDFEESLDGYQLLRDLPVGRTVSGELRELVNYCVGVNAAVVEDQDTNITPEQMSFLGKEAFPKIIQEKVALKYKRQEVKRRIRKSQSMSKSASYDSTMAESGGEYDSGAEQRLLLEIEELVAPESFIGPEQPVKLAGPPQNVLAVFRETVSYGKGLHGMVIKDVISLLQALASTKMQTCFRCFRCRWRYSKARARWRFIDSTRLARHYNGWRDLTRYNIALRHTCWRKIKAWQYFTRRVRARREAFRLCFWPLYTWKKMSNASATSREKIRFLVNRVQPLYLTLRVFRAWKGYTKIGVTLTNAADKFLRSRMQDAEHMSLLWWRSWARKRKHIRRSWFRSGISKLRAVTYRRKITPFIIWKTYAAYRKLVRARVCTETSAFRRLLLQDRLPLRLKSNSERRVKDGLRARKQREMREKRKKDPSSSRRKRRSSKEDSGGAGGGGGSVAGSSRASSRAQSRKVTSRGKSRAGTSGGRRTDSSAGESSEGDFDDAMSITSSSLLAYAPPFNWLDGCTGDFDMQSDGEDKEDVPEVIQRLYSASVSAFPVPDGDPFPREISFLTYADEYFIDKGHDLCKGFQHTDKWNIFEAAMRFQRMAHRAFKNLRHNAIVKSGMKRAILKKQRVVKRIVFDVFQEIVSTGTRRGALYKLTDAERLNNLVQAHHVSQVVFRRQTIAQLKELARLATEAGGDQLTEKQREYRKKRPFSPTNFISKTKTARSGSSGGVGGGGTKNDPRAALKALTKGTALENYEPPNLLHQDRLNREKESELAKEMLVYSHEVKESLAVFVAESDFSSAEVHANRALRNEVVVEVLKGETDVTTAAMAAQLEYVKDFKVHAADKLITVLAKVYVEVQISLVKEETRIYFRALRFPMVLKRSISMYNRKRMINWIRLCRRLNSVSRLAPFYYRKKLLWVRFNRWIKLLERAKLDCTPGILPIIRRKCELHPDFNHNLESQGFKKVVYHNNLRLNQSASKFLAIFQRWKMYTQEKILFKMMRGKASALYRLRLLQRCLWALKTGLSLSENLRLIESQPKQFPIVRIEADLDQLAKRFISSRRHGVSHVITKYNRKYDTQMKESGKTSLSFKKFLIDFTLESTNRINNEQRILSESFEQRGLQEFVDVKAPMPNHPAIPAIMNHLDGKLITDPHEVRTTVDATSSDHLHAEIPSSYYAMDKLLAPKSRVGSAAATAAAAKIEADGKFESAIPAGFRLSKLRFVLMEKASIVGWQVVWSADSAKDVESPRRGVWNAAAIEVKEIVVPKEDFVIGLEYMYEGGITLGVRAKMFFAGFTKWIGKKSSMSTLSAYLGCDLAPTEDFESDRDVFSADEKENPALPCNFVIGITGKIINHRTTCLGLVVRKVKRQNIFSYFWVQDQIVKRAEMEASLEAQASGRSITFGIESVPSKIAYRDNSHDPTAVAGGNLRDESLTMTAALDHPPVPGSGYSFGHNVSSGIGFEGSSSLDFGGQSSSTLLEGIQELNDEGERVAAMQLTAEEELQKAQAMGQEATAAIGGIGSTAAAGALGGRSIAMSLSDDDLSVERDPLFEGSGINFGSAAEQELDEDEEEEGEGDDRSGAMKLDDDDDDGSVNRGDDDSLATKSTDNQTKALGTNNLAADTNRRALREERQRKKRLRQRKREFEERMNAPLKDAILESETQFFDVLRMRSTELTSATQRVHDFARNLWSKKDIRNDPILSKLTAVNIVYKLSFWLFNALSKRLMPVSSTERHGLTIIKNAKKMLNRVDTLSKRCNIALTTSETMKMTPQPWMGKPLLAPAERQQKKDYLQKIIDLQEKAQRALKEAIELRDSSNELIRLGKKLLPRIHLTTYVYNNYRLKILASRHKQSLLERMDMDAIKNGMFGIDGKESSLSKVHMESVHASIREHRVLMEKEAAEAEAEGAKARARRADPAKSLENFVEQVLIEEMRESNAEYLAAQEAKRANASKSSSRKGSQLDALVVEERARIAEWSRMRAQHAARAAAEEKEKQELMRKMRFQQPPKISGLSSSAGGRGYRRSSTRRNTRVSTPGRDFDDTSSEKHSYF